MTDAYRGNLSVKHLQVFGWENAIRGMRFPKNSEKLMDSIVSNNINMVSLGEKDKSLLLRLTKAGRDHRKVLRMIHVQVALAMPISWWIQMDTYKVATVANSRSRMHKFGTAEITRDDFYTLEQEKSSANIDILDQTIKLINNKIFLYKIAKEENDTANAKLYWREALDLLPMTYIQERMWDANYETLISMYHSRYNEKLKGEWRFFLDVMLSGCPYLEEICEASKNSRTMSTEEFESEKK